MWIIPVGITKVKVKLWGGGGGGGGITNDNEMVVVNSFAGGSGGFTSCTLNVIPGQTLRLLVAGGGQSNGYGLTGYGGFGGGGNGNTDASNYGYAPGGGGGRSAIRLSELGDDIATAGGGGGGVGYWDGWSTGLNGGLCGGGLHGCSPLDSNPRSGSGGSQIIGGVGGSSEYGFTSGNSGIRYQGGNGGTYGGGGGGDYNIS